MAWIDFEQTASGAVLEHKSRPLPVAQEAVESIDVLIS